MTDWHEAALEMDHAIHRLPKPPEEIGDGPDERVGYALQRIRDLEQQVEHLKSNLNALQAHKRIAEKVTAYTVLVDGEIKGVFKHLKDAESHLETILRHPQLRLIESFRVQRWTVE